MRPASFSGLRCGVRSSQRKKLLRWPASEHAVVAELVAADREFQRLVVVAAGLQPDRLRSDGAHGQEMQVDALDREDPQFLARRRRFDRAEGEHRREGIEEDGAAMRLREEPAVLIRGRADLGRSRVERRGADERVGRLRGHPIGTAGNQRPPVDDRPRHAARLGERGEHPARFGRAFETPRRTVRPLDRLRAIGESPDFERPEGDVVRERFPRREDRGGVGPEGERRRQCGERGVRVRLRSAARHP